MNARRDFRAAALLRRLARPVLLPLLRKTGWARGTRTGVPRVSARDRLRESEVASRVSVRDDETLLLNGEPFFPVGLYYAQDELADATGEGLRKLRAMGFNTIFFNGGLDSETQLDRIRDAGLHVWYRPPGELYHQFDLLKQLVLKFAPHPAMLFWEMGDEPVLNGLKFSEVETGCRIVRGVDPYHPILCNQWLSDLGQVEEMRRWAGLADIYGFAAYPVPLGRWGTRMSLVERGWPHSVAVVGRQTRLWRSLAPRKPVIPVMQAWAWNCLEDGEAAYPTYRECRFMAYQAVIHGAKGLHHYGVADPLRPYVACGIPPRIREDLEQTHADFLKAQQYNRRFWSYYSQVIKELSRMSDVFTSRDAEWTPEILETHPRQTGSARVEWRAKRYLDSTVVLAVNASDERAPVEVRAPELSGVRLNVWGEGRSIQVSTSGLFRDVFEPYGVRVYSEHADLLADFSNSITSGDEHGGSDCPAEEDA